MATGVQHRPVHSQPYPTHLMSVPVLQVGKLWSQVWLLS